MIDTDSLVFRAGDQASTSIIPLTILGFKVFHGHLLSFLRSHFCAARNRFHCGVSAYASTTER